MKKIGLILVVFAFLVYCASTGQSQEVSPDVGDNAPDFSIVDVSGNEIRLGDFKEKKNVVLVFYADSTCRMAHGRLGELQKGISEIEKLNAEVIAISTRGNQDDVKISRMVQKITFTLIPKPNRKVVEDFGLKYDSNGAAHALIIIGKKGHIRFKSVDEHYSWTSASRIIKELQGIQ
jgi:peroxiredoxin